MTQQPKTNQSAKPESVWKHLVSFLVMIILTAAAFYLVAVDVVPKHWILPLILLFATIQVLLQLFTFMHLSQKGTLMYTIFILVGIVIAVVSAIGIVWMDNNLN